MVNIPNLNKLLEFLNNDAVDGHYTLHDDEDFGSVWYFSMDVFYNELNDKPWEADWCHTAGCLGGIICLMENEIPLSYREMQDYPFDKKGQEFLGITEDEADELFYGHHSQIMLNTIDINNAIECLEYIKEHGKVPLWKSVLDLEYDNDLNWLNVADIVY